MPRHPVLPADIILPICEYLGESDVASVLNFALVYKEWEAISHVVLHRNISIAVTNWEKLAHDVEDCRSFLQRTSSFGLVHSLEITGPGWELRRYCYCHWTNDIRPYNYADKFDDDMLGWRFVPDSRERLDKIMPHFEDRWDDSDPNQRHPFSLKSERLPGYT